MAATEQPLTAPKCPVCINIYDEDERCPRILTECGHTLCDTCTTRMRKNAKTLSVIICPLCKTTTRFAIHEKPLKNYAVIGQAQLQPAEPAPTTEAPSIPSESLFFDDSVKPRPETAGHLLNNYMSLNRCAHCDDDNIYYGCRRCAVNYCTKCWHIVHRAGAMHFHQSEKPISFQERRCFIHPDKALTHVKVLIEDEEHDNLFAPHKRHYSFHCEDCLLKLSEEEMKRTVLIEKEYASQLQIHQEYFGYLQRCMQHVQTGMIQGDADTHKQAVVCKSIVDCEFERVTEHLREWRDKLYAKVDARELEVKELRAQAATSYMGFFARALASFTRSEQLVKQDDPAEFFMQYQQDYEFFDTEFVQPKEIPFGSVRFHRRFFSDAMRDIINAHGCIQTDDERLHKTTVHEWTGVLIPTFPTGTLIAYTGHFTDALGTIWRSGIKACKNRDGKYMMNFEVQPHLGQFKGKAWSRHLYCVIRVHNFKDAGKGIVLDRKGSADHQTPFPEHTNVCPYDMESGFSSVDGLVRISITITPITYTD